MVFSFINIVKQIKSVPFNAPSMFYSLNTSVKSPSSSLVYCLESVKKYDYENYLCTLFLPKQLVPAAISIRAFNIELALVHDMVSEVIIGQMRFQFWEDTIDQLYQGTIPNHPVCSQLAKASGIELLNCDHASSHLGKAMSLTNLLRGALYDTRRSRILIPVDLLMKHNVSQEQILRHSTDKSMKDLTFDVASTINHHLEHVEKLQKNVERISRLIFLPTECIHSYLKNLRSVDFNVFHPKLQQKNQMLAARLFWKQLFI